MATIAFPSNSSPGRSPEEGAGRLVNVLLEKIQNGARSQVTRRRAPGLARFADAGLTGPRGFLLVGNTLYGAFHDVIAKVTPDGAVTVIGSLPGTKRVTMARNNRRPTADVVAVTEFGAYTIRPDQAPAPLAIPGELPAPNSVTGQDGYLVFSAGDGRAFVSGLNATSFNTLDYTTEQSHQGGLSRAVAYRSELFLMGPNGIGVYRDTGNATGFPFSKVTDIVQGLIGPWAVAGFEEGWVNELLWVGLDGVVYQLQGYAGQAVSTPDVERAILSVADRTQIEASVHASAGHAIFVLSGPDWTWTYDLRTGTWQERRSHGLERWRATLSVKAFNRWLVGDTIGTRLLEVREDVYDEDGAPLVFEIESVPGESFPSRLAIPRADFDFVVGQGIAGGGPAAAPPQLAVSWSDDGRVSWSNALLRSLGRQGESRARVSVLRTGMSGPLGRVWRLRVSDPAYVALVGGAMAVEARTE